MKIKSSVVLVLILVAAVPLMAGGKKKETERGMLEKMEAVPCGAKQKGLTGVGALWASAGITSVNSTEKMCPQYLLRTDEMEYEIRPTDSKHPAVLPVGQEGEFKINKDHMFLRVADGGDGKMRTYQVVGVKPTNADSAAQGSSGKSSDTP